MIDVVALQSLLAVSAQGSVAGAAQTLGYTPSAVSQQIKRLEREMAAPLLERVGRGVVLTPEGRLLVEEGQRLVGDLEGVRSRIASRGGAVRGRVRMAAFSTAVRGLVGPLLADLAGSAPELDLVLVEHDPPEAVDLLAGGQVEVAVVHNWIGVGLHLPGGLVARDLGTDRADVLVPAGHPLAARAAVTPVDLLAETWVSTPPGTICHAWFLHMFAGHPRPPRVAFRSGEFASHVALVAQGVAVSLVPRLGRGDLPPGVVAVPVEDPEPLRGVQVLCRSSMAGSAAVRHLSDRLAALWPAQPIRNASSG